MMNEFKVPVDDTYCHVIKFGNGSNILIILPGINLCGLKGQGEAIEKAYDIFSKDFTCFLIDIRKDVTPGFTINNICDDIYRVVKYFDIKHAFVYGVSMGGITGCLLESKYPNTLDKFVVCSSMCKTTKKANKVINEWISYARNHDVVSLNSSFINHCYSRKFIEQYKPVMETLLNQGTFEQCDRFAILCEILLNLDIRSQMRNINCDTLVLGDTNDNVIGIEGSYEIKNIIDCDVYIYDKYSHAVYDEADDIKERIYNFMIGK